MALPKIPNDYQFKYIDFLCLLKFILILELQYLISYIINHVKLINHIKLLDFMFLSLI